MQKKPRLTSAISDGTGIQNRDLSGLRDKAEGMAVFPEGGLGYHRLIFHRQEFMASRGIPDVIAANPSNSPPQVRKREPSGWNAMPLIG